MTFRWGRFSGRGSVGNVVRTRLKRNMWKHSWSTYLGGTRLSHSQLATAPLWGEGSLVCDRDEVIFEDYCCGRYHMWHSSFLQGYTFLFQDMWENTIPSFFKLHILSHLSLVGGTIIWHAWSSRSLRSVVPHEPWSDTFHSYEPDVESWGFKASAYQQCCSIG